MSESHTRNLEESVMKNSRRAFITGAATIAAATGVAAGAAKAAEPANKQEQEPSPFLNCKRATGGPNAKRFPQVIVQDQNKRKAWFYEEMVDGKLVLVSFTSVKGEEYYPIISNLVKVQEMLGDRLGKDVFMYTITTNPYEDTPEDLKALADKHGAKWQFLTGEPEPLRDLLGAFHARGSLFGVSWIGNEKTGRWLNKPSRLHPLYIAEAVARLSTGIHHKAFLVDMHSV